MNVSYSIGYVSTAIPTFSGQFEQAFNPYNRGVKLILDQGHIQPNLIPDGLDY